MNQEMNQSFPLKLKEEETNPENIWKKHGALERELKRDKVTARLTKLIKEEENPLVISVNGSWGTGKTFLLQLWQHQLEKEGFKSIYFNAWKDDNFDDPLIAIIGQLSASLDQNCVKKVFKGMGWPFLKGGLNKPEQILNNIFGTVWFILKVILDWTCQTLGGRSVAEKMISYFEGKYVNTISAKYTAQGRVREDLKKNLENMADGIKKETGKPLIFIIDELDRCRPTFAVELLERVKHIFNVPNIFFIFGINREGLCKSLRSIYGEIEADIYMRRFFDIEFPLPLLNSKSFCEYSMQKYNLSACLSIHAHAYDTRAYAYDELEKFLPTFYSYFDLSLRDIDYCIRSLLFAVKSLPREKVDYMLASLLGVLIMLRLINPSIYEGFIQGKQPAGEIMNYIHERVPMDELNLKFRKLMIYLEGDFYSMDTNPSAEPSYPHRQIKRLRLLEKGEKLLKEERYLSSWIQQTDIMDERGHNKAIALRERIEGFMNGSNFKSSHFSRGVPVSVLSNLMDITKMEIHRG